MKSPFINNIIILLALFLALGITFGFYANQYDLTMPSNWLAGVLAFCIVLLGLAWQIGKRKLHPSPIFGILVCFVFFGIGFATYTLRLPKYHPQHYTNKTNDDGALFQLRVKEYLKSNNYYENYIVEVVSQNTSRADGLMLFHIQKDTAFTPLKIDELVLVKVKPEHIREPKNLYQFNYAQYMQHLGVYREVSIKPHDILLRRKDKTSLIGFSEGIRRHLITKLQETTLQDDQLNIVQALLLGERKYIDKELYEAYAAAGAIHILAVSGLHVGILYFILLFLLKSFTYIKQGATIRSILIIILLWGFAILAGLSPSVVRAVTMFSFFTMATAINRPTNGFNTLFLSFFILLLIAPSWLFHVGFQLSYLAVFFILWLQPKLYALYKPRFYVDKTLWGIVTVTIAAQAGILPLSLFYFHQFPGLFFLTNIVVLPVLGMLLAGGLLLIVLAACDAAPKLYVEGYSYAISLLNRFITWVAQQDTFLVSNISFSVRKIVASYLVLVCLVLLWKKACAKHILISLASIALFIGVCIWDKDAASLNEMIVFHKNRSTLIGVKEKQQLYLFYNDTMNLNYRYPVKGYLTKMAIDSVIRHTIPTLFTYGENTILVMDSLGVYPKKFQVDVVIITQSPRVNLTRLIDSLHPKLIIADGSNYNSYIARWKETCYLKKLPFHHTGNKGALTFK